jgi:hypothetical protein
MPPKVSLGKPAAAHASDLDDTANLVDLVNRVRVCAGCGWCKRSGDRRTLLSRADPAHPELRPLLIPNLAHPTSLWVCSKHCQPKQVAAVHAKAASLQAAGLTRPTRNRDVAPKVAQVVKASTALAAAASGQPVRNPVTADAAIACQPTLDGIKRRRTEPGTAPAQQQPAPTTGQRAALGSPHAAAAPMVVDGGNLEPQGRAGWPGVPAWLDLEPAAPEAMETEPQQAPGAEGWVSAWLLACCAHEQLAQVCVLTACLLVTCSPTSGLT